MNSKNLDFYLKAFSSLKRDRQNGGAPHKPVLLISLIDLFESKIINSSKVYITPELVSTFKSNWSKFVINQNSSLSFALPFYHMRSEPFWTLIANPGCEVWVNAKSSMRSFSNLNIAIDYAQIDNDLFNILINQNFRKILYSQLVSQYFPDSEFRSPSTEDNSLVNIRNDILHSEPKYYVNSLKILENDLGKESFDEEVFVRNSIFKREIPRIYNYRCCISGLRIDVTENITILDACHIRPFSESYDDTITNGIALCPTLHRAFDRGLISINKNYRVIISSKFTEPFASVYSISQFNGQKIFLPESDSMRPSQENLEKHRVRFGFQ